jgi:hypothetical protein
MISFEAFVDEMQKIAMSENQAKAVYHLINAGKGTSAGIGGALGGTIGATTGFLRSRKGERGGGAMKGAIIGGATGAGLGLAGPYEARRRVVNYVRKHKGLPEALTEVTKAKLTERMVHAQKPKEVLRKLYEKGMKIPPSATPS